MSTNLLFLLELAIFNGVVLAWAGWELWSVRKGKDTPSSPSPEDPGHPKR